MIAASNPYAALPSLMERHRRQISAFAAAQPIRERATARTAALVRPSPMPTPEQCKAKGNGADDSVPLQAWLNLGGPLSLPTRYLHHEPLYISSGTTIYGHGIGELHCPKPVCQLTHRNYVFSGDKCIDHDITLDGVTLSGDPAVKVPWETQRTSWIGVRKLTFRNCHFRDSRRYLALLSNCYDTTVTGTEFSGWGVIEPHTGPPGDWFAGVAFFMLAPCFNTRFTDNYLHDGTGIGAWFAGDGEGLDLSGSRFVRTAEAAVVGFPPNTTANHILIDGVTRPGISGHGLELQVSDWSLTDSIIRNCAGANVYVTDPQRVVIADNLLGNSNDDGGAMMGSIVVRTATADPAAATTDLTLANNQIYARNGKGERAITLANWSGNDKSLMRLSVVSNDTGDPTQWRGGDPLLITPDKQRVIRAGSRILANAFVDR